MSRDSAKTRDAAAYVTAEERGIALRYVVAVVAAVVLTLVLFATIAVLLTLPRLDDRTRTAANDVAAALAKSAATPVWNVDEEALGDVVATALMNREVVYARVTAEQEVLAERRQGDGLAHEGILTSPHFVHASATVYNENEPIGQVDIAISRAGIVGEVRRQLLSMLALGLVLCVVVSVTSIVVTRRYVYRPLVELKHAAETASLSKSAFLANMSHEIRTPMTAILGYSDLLDEAGQDEDERRSFVRTIRANGEHLLAIINDILDLSKIESGQLTAETVPVDPVRVLRDVLDLMRLKAEAKGIALDCQFQCPIPLVISTDPTRLRQILVNLIGNAIKFTQIGRVQIEVGLLEERGAPRMVFDVIDTGIGIATDDIPRLFEPFTQGDASATRLHGGTGLGLSISRRLARMLGGEIFVSSERGRGTRFTVTVQTGALDGIERVDVPSIVSGEAVPGTTIRPNLSVEGEVLAGFRLLIAEDNAVNQRLVAHLIRSAGASVEITDNGELAIDSVVSHHEQGTPFDVVLMDMQMPVLDGYAAVARLRSEGFTLPIIALTAHAMKGDRDRCLECGCDEHVSKPVDRVLLLATVRAVVERARVAARADANAASPSSSLPPTAARPGP